MNRGNQLNSVTTITIILNMCLYFGGQYALAEQFSPYLKVGTSSKGLKDSPKKIVRTFKGHKRSVTSIAFSPNGRLLASGS